MTYGQWTVRWWQWLTAIPTKVNPAADENGVNATVNQTDPNVWFLAGTLGGRSVHRNCTIPFGRSVLFPVINYEMNPIEKPELRTESQLVTHVIKDEDDITNLEAIIDGQEIPIYRVRSDPPMFSLTFPADNLFDASDGGTTRATSDGYWVFLKPLEHGKHKLFFAGSCSAGSRNVKATYNLTVSI
ncbi:MAG: hypothetical protein ACRD4B_09265 [Acidobacteriota bacterium]